MNFKLALSFKEKKNIIASYFDVILSNHQNYVLTNISKKKFDPIYHKVEEFKVFKDALKVLVLNITFKI